MNIDKTDIKMITDALDMYIDFLWKMSCASYLGGNVPEYYKPRYERFLLLKKFLLKEIRSKASKKE